MMIPIRSLRLLAGSGALLTALAWPAAAGAKSRPIDEHRPADAAGQVEIQDVAGRIEVVGWDKPEVAVTGTVGADVERVDVTSEGSRTAVHVVSHESHGVNFSWHGSSDEAELVVHVPAGSGLTTTLVSADLKVTGVAGKQELHSVSGDITTSAQRELRVQTVSGDVHATAGADSRLIQIWTVSGDVTLAGGAGELEVKTVSGDGTLAAGALTRGHLNTVSGDFTLTAGLAADGRLEAESVSGDFTINFAGGVPPAAFDLQTFSGDLSTCFGRKPAHEGYGPGSRLSFQEGAGSAHVRVDTKSGDVTLCSKK
jgi:Putative adhesin